MIGPSGDFSPGGDYPEYSEHCIEPKTVTSEYQAAILVRMACEVGSRRVFNLNPEAADRWRELDHKYQAWLRVPQC